MKNSRNSSAAMGFPDGQLRADRILPDRTRQQAAALREALEVYRAGWQARGY